MGLHAIGLPQTQGGLDGKRGRKTVLERERLAEQGSDGITVALKFFGGVMIRLARIQKTFRDRFGVHVQVRISLSQYGGNFVEDLLPFRSTAPLR